LIFCCTARVGSKSSRTAPAGSTGKTGYPAEATALLIEQEVHAMRIKPTGITFILRMSRTGWLISVRITFAK
jgi:hypothetical protein